MTEVNELNILRHCLVPLGPDWAAVVERLQTEQLAVIRSSLVELLISEANSEHSSVTLEESSTSAPQDFKSVISKSKAGNTVVAFNFTDAASETALQILGIAIVLFTTGTTVAAGPQIAAVIRTLWKKLVILKRPEDADAIDLLDSLTRIRARYILSKADIFPTAIDIQSDVKLSDQRARLAFSKLRSKGVLKIVEWGDQEDDTDNSENRWAIAL